MYVVLLALAAQHPVVDDRPLDTCRDEGADECVGVTVRAVLGVTGVHVVRHRADQSNEMTWPRSIDTQSRASR